MDNGPGFAGKALDAWVYRKIVKLHVIRPGQPVENACVERFSGRYRDECLNENLFRMIDEARSVIEPGGSTTTGIERTACPAT